MDSLETPHEPPGIIDTTQKQLTSTIKPIPLPPGITDKEEFYAWKISSIDQLKQNEDYQLFLPGGK